jgi:hypothetical protein
MKRFGFIPASFLSAVRAACYDRVSLCRACETEVKFSCDKRIATKARRHQVLGKEDFLKDFLSPRHGDSKSDLAPGGKTTLTKMLIA